MADYSLFLDDYRFPNWVFWVPMPAVTNWIIARRYFDFVHYIETYGVPSFISFDHDLDRHNIPKEQLPDPENDGVNFGNGLDCAKWLVEFCKKKGLPFPNYVVHSTNPVQGPTIGKYIEENK